MSDYQLARARFARAIGGHEDARAAHEETGKRLAAADAELADAGRVLARFEIDPEYRLPQHLTGVPA